MGEHQHTTMRHYLALLGAALAVLAISAAAPRPEVDSEAFTEVEPLGTQQQSLSQVDSTAHSKARYRRLPYFFNPKKSAKENANKKMWNGRRFAYFHDQKLDHSEAWNKAAAKKDNEAKNKAFEKASRADLRRRVQKEVAEAKGKGLSEAKATRKTKSHSKAKSSPSSSAWKASKKKSARKMKTKKTKKGDAAKHKRHPLHAIAKFLGKNKKVFLKKKRNMTSKKKKKKMVVTLSETNVSKPHSRKSAAKKKKANPHKHPHPAATPEYVRHYLHILGKDIKKDKEKKKHRAWHHGA